MANRYKDTCRLLRGVLKHGFDYRQDIWWFRRNQSGNAIYIGMQRDDPVARVDQTTISIVPSIYSYIFENFAVDQKREVKWVDRFKVKNLRGCSKLDWWTKPLPEREQSNPTRILEQFMAQAEEIDSIFIDGPGSQPYSIEYSPSTTTTSGYELHEQRMRELINLRAGQEIIQP
jgi:hypothetical protein